MFFKYLFLYCGFISICNSARILAVFPAPFPSHQSVFRPFTQELAKRGHEVVVITTDPVFKDNPSSNYTEIDIHEVSYKFRDINPPKITGRTNDVYVLAEHFFKVFGEILEIQMKSNELKNFINDKTQHFDLLIIEACIRPALIFSHLFKVPVITISSLGSLDMFTEYLGVPIHPILYPNCAQQKLNNLTVWDRAIELYNYFCIDKMIKSKEVIEDEMLRRIFGSDVPPLRELKKNIVMLMINVHRIWENNRPVPPNVVYLGGLHLAGKVSNKMTAELKQYLDSSSQGVIYMSLGSLVVPSLLENLKIVLQALSKLPYNILLKWDQDQLSECPSNFKVMKWTPQRELLYHPNIKLFITQGGLQSTDEAIVAEVPLIGIPVLGDQWYNVEKYVQLKIGLRIDLESVTEEKMLNAVNTVIGDKSFKRNIQDLHRKVIDQPQSALDRAVWWTEYILRHGNTTINNHHYLLSSAVHMSAWEYHEMDLILVLISMFCVFLSIIVFAGLNLFRIVRRNVVITKPKSS